MMRIAIAGTGGLASWIAHYIQQETPHQVLLLSRTSQPSYEARGIAVQAVDYNNAEALRFALSGIDIIVSTILGDAQLRLIEAAVRARVRRFIPAEFEGPPRLRAAGDPLDRRRRAALDMLRQYRAYIESTVIVCGIFYERFQPGGLIASNIGSTSGFSREGDYIMNIRAMSAQVPVYDRHNQFTSICMTSVRDVAHFVVRAFEIEQWPAELSIYGDTMPVMDLVALVSQLKGGQQFNPVTWYSPDMLRSELNQAVASQDVYKQRRTQALLATAERQYEFGNANLRQYFPNIQTQSFREWVKRVWNF